MLQILANRVQLCKLYFQKEKYDTLQYFTVITTIQF